MVMAGIESEQNLVARRKVVAPAEARGDLRRFPHVGVDRHVEVAFVVSHPHYRALGRRRHVVGFILNQIVDGVGGCPDLLVQAAVDLRRAPGDPERAQLLARLLWHRGLRRAGLVLRMRRPRIDEAQHCSDG